ncbi:hypothetical protein NRB20_60350 [Nocardia sp. RB20]|uniref:Uncharacterized protein n=1 Tax=Nocardia macrotermitis TaxID=2585198 RepID=A0A7K0DBL4_9NOCA|nr:hypothetical protein [Nocardia macrotermitis]
MISKIGYDPSTRKRQFDVAAEYTFLTCQVTNSYSDLQLTSGNITMDEDRQRYAGKVKIADTTIDGRNAIILHKTNADECDLDMQTKVGYFEVSILIDDASNVNGVKSCDHITDISTLLETFVGKDN